MNLIRNYRNWRRYRDTVNELSRLSNRELNDLGISRAEIVTVAQRAPLDSSRYGEASSSSQPCRFRNPPDPVRRVLFLGPSCRMGLPKSLQLA